MVSVRGAIPGATSQGKADDIMEEAYKDVQTISDLVKTPWFEADAQGAIRLRRDVGLPPIIDMHSHLGYSFLFSRWIDHKKKTDKVKYYYDFNVPHDILYGDAHPTKEELKWVESEIYMIIFRRPASGMTHTIANLHEEMERMNYRHICSLPIEIPLRSRHAHHTVNSCRGQEGVIPFAAVHPWTINPRKRLEWLVANGARGLKFHPEFQFHPPDTAKAMRIFGYCEEMGLPVLAHSGYTGTEPAWMRQWSEMERFEPAIKAFPKLKFILGHSGLKLYEKGVEMNRKYPNVYLEFSGRPVPIIRDILKKADTDRVCYGSDWPFYPLAVGLARALVALEGESEELRNKILAGNAARVLGIAQG